MANYQSWIALVTGIIAVLSTVVYLTRYLTRVQEQAERNKLAEENRGHLRKVAELEARCGQLVEQISVGGVAGSAALHQKAEIDARLRAIMATTGASGGSVYLPVRTDYGEVYGLAFLSFEPFSPQTAALRAKVIPLKSLAGTAFTKGSFVMKEPAKSADHFKSAEELSNYRPSTILNVALKHDRDVVGVLQLLSKEGEAGFGEHDVARVTGLSKEITDGVAEIARNSDYLRALGLGAEPKGVTGTVLYFDLSCSSLLFQELSSSFALQRLNEYFEEVCEAAFRAGATLDNYMGDGALLRFNVPRPQADHELHAVRAAIEMNQAFERVKEYWISLNLQFKAIQQRIGIATGPLLRANLGHSQLQSLTVIGYPIAVAAALCEAADRDRTLVIADFETYDAVKDVVSATPLAANRLGKAARFTDGAWEITAIK